MPYKQTIDRRHPACIVFLLDQSGSMAEVMGGAPGVSKAQALADTINELLYTILRRSAKDRGQPLRYYYDLSVIGYANEVKPVFDGPLAGRYLASVEEVSQIGDRVTGPDGVVRAIWVRPEAEGRTAMCAALELAGKIVSGWIGPHGDSFPPIVINVSDGKATDGKPERLAEVGAALRSLSTADGQVLLFNINLSTNARQAIAFPTDGDVGRLPDEYARQLYALSSPLPDLMMRQAERLGIPVQPGAHGFVCNADLSTVVMALEVGTTLDQLEEY